MKLLQRNIYQDIVLINSTFSSSRYMYSFKASNYLWPSLKSTDCSTDLMDFFKERLPPQFAQYYKSSSIVKVGDLKLTTSTSIQDKPLSEFFLNNSFFVSVKDAPVLKDFMLTYKTTTTGSNSVGFSIVNSEKSSHLSIASRYRFLFTKNNGYLIHTSSNLILLTIYFIKTRICYSVSEISFCLLTDKEEVCGTSANNMLLFGSMKASSQYTSSAWKDKDSNVINAFDSDYKTVWLSDYNGQVSQWIEFAFVSSVTILSYSIYTPHSSSDTYSGQNPQDWELQQYNSNGTWTSIDGRSGQVADWIVDKGKTFYLHQKYSMSVQILSSRLELRVSTTFESNPLLVYGRQLILSGVVIINFIKFDDNIKIRVIQEDGEVLDTIEYDACYFSTLAGYPSFTFPFPYADLQSLEVIIYIYIS